MRLTMILIRTFIDKLSKLYLNLKQRIYGKKIIQMETPSICESRQEKDEIILATIEHLESNIKIR